LATVSTPVPWGEVERGVEIEDFRLTNVPERVRRLGDLWVAPAGGDRFDLRPLITPAARHIRPHA
jgi:bifunctional non-homologous end joining protein LigD